MKNNVTLPLRITGVYLLIAMIWVFLLDVLMYRLDLDPGEAERIHILKDVIFVVSTAVLLFLGLRSSVRRLSSALEVASQNERRWIMALDGAGHGVWDWNATTNQVFYSVGWKTMLGFEEAEIGNGLNEWEERVHPDDIARCYADLERHFQGMAPFYRNEHRMRCKDGSYKWILDQGMVFARDADGKPARVVGTHTDISAQKATEQALAEGKARYRLLIENQTDLVVKVDAEGRFEFVSPSYCEAFGKTEAQLLGKNFMPLVHEEDRASTAAAMQTLGMPPYTAYLEQRAMTHQGWRWLAWSDKAVTDDQGRVTAIVGVGRDITDRKRADAALRESETRYRELVENMSDGVAVYDVLNDGGEFRFRDLNRAGERISRVRKVEILGRSVEEVFPGVRKMGLIEVFERVWRSGQPERYPLSRYRDSRIDLWLENYVFRLPNDQLVAIFEDATERRRAEHELRESERRLTTLMTNLPGMAYRCQDDRWRTMQFASQGCRALTGYASRALEGNRDLSYSELVVSEDLPRMRAEIRRCYVIGKAFELEYRIRRKDGSTIWVWERGQAVRDRQGAVGLIEGFVTDITSRKQAEDSIREMNEVLEQRVEQRTAELTTANRELESFTYAVSHDLRAPLRAMRGFSQALKEDYRRQMPAQALKFLDQIELAGVRMGELIDALLSLSRSTRGELNRAPVDLAQVARAAHQACASAAPDRQVSLETQGDLTAQVDPRLARTLLQNLLDNAWKYTVKTKAPRIVVAAREEAGEACICVEDNGAGFDMAFVDKLYEPFQRLHRQDEFPGVGVGLATVQRIVHRHGGWIKAHGEPGCGSRFCFTLGPKVESK